MSHNLCPVLPADRQQGSFVIRWWEATPSDESRLRQAEFRTLAEAEEVLGWIAANPASDGICCSWLDPTFDAIPF